MIQMERAYIAVSPYFMARPKRFELLTPWFVAKYSIQLSYGRVKKARIIGEMFLLDNGG